MLCVHQEKIQSWQLHWLQHDYVYMYLQSRQCINLKLNQIL